MLCRTQRVVISNPDSCYFGAFGVVTDAFPRRTAFPTQRTGPWLNSSGTYLVRMDASGAAIAFGFSEVVPAPSGNRKGTR